MRIFYGATPVLQVVDVARSLAWYGDVLGFAADPFPQAPPHSFAILTRDRAEVMLQCAGEGDDGASAPPTPDAVPATPRRGWSVYLRLRGGSLLEFAGVVGEKTAVLRGPERMPYGDVEFEVADPDGHRVCVGEPLPPGAEVPAARSD